MEHPKNKSDVHVRTVRTPSDDAYLVLRATTTPENRLNGVRLKTHNAAT